jgi:hypothetical protein
MEAIQAAIMAGMQTEEHLNNPDGGEFQQRNQGGVVAGIQNFLGMNRQEEEEDKEEDSKRE